MITTSQPKEAVIEICYKQLVSGGCALYFEHAAHFFQDVIAAGIHFQNILVMRQRTIVILFVDRNGCQIIKMADQLVLQIECGGILGVASVRFTK